MSSSSFNSPFRNLKKTVKLPEKSVSVVKPKPEPPPEPEIKETEEELFWREMQGVAPIKQDGRVRVSSPPPRVTKRALAEENEALAELYDLVAGRTGFDITDTEEYVEGCVIGLDTTLVRKLRQGDFSRQAALDLHGMKVDAAQVELERFLLNAVRTGLRCVLIVHGRGKIPPDKWRCSKIASSRG